MSGSRISATSSGLLVAEFLQHTVHENSDHAGSASDKKAKEKLKKRVYQGSPVRFVLLCLVNTSFSSYLKFVELFIHHQRENGRYLSAKDAI